MFHLMVMVVCVVAIGLFIQNKGIETVAQLGVELHPVDVNRMNLLDVIRSFWNAKKSRVWTHCCKDIDMSNDEIRDQVILVRRYARKHMHSVMCLPKHALLSSGSMAKVRSTYLDFVEEMDILVSYSFGKTETLRIEARLLANEPRAYS